ncbi:hypothetical protein HOM13_04555 [Candidatus Woesearchaeota archaeon]|mgnify:FL=1|jgi:hypothetical protein|nr:hypothetical protein [Candidatus Woesearchaeota archaeon]
MRSATYFIVGLILLAMALKMGTDKQFIKAMVLISVSIINLSIAGIMLRRKKK